MDSVYSVYNLPNKVLHHLTASIEENVGIYNNIREDNGMTIDTILKERAITHGDYPSKCETIQQLKSIMRTADGFYELSADQAESLDLICTKIGRILYGDPNHIDSWLDIAGYSQLIVNRLQSETEAPIPAKTSRAKG